MDKLTPTTTADLPNLQKGDTFVNGDGTTGTVNFDYKTGKPLADPVTSSSGVRNNVTALGNDIKNGYDSSGLSSNSNDMLNFINDRVSSLKSDFTGQISGIKSSYDVAEKDLENTQTKDYAGRSTSLVTSGGGFLGATQSHEGVLQNLKVTFQNERDALQAKRDAALQAANSAYQDKNFALAQDYLKTSKETEQEIYNRTQDFTNTQLKLSSEARAQTEFDMGLADKKAAAFANMTDAEFAKQDPATIAQIDKAYYPGYVEDKRKLDQAATALKNEKDQAALDVQIIGALAKIPAGQKVTIGGNTYTGMKSAALGNVISPLVIDQIPALAGVKNMKQEDVILSLALPTPPAWYKEFLTKSEPGKTFSPEGVKSIWDTFRNSPDLQPFINTVRLNKAQSINATSNILNSLSADTQQKISDALTNN